MMSWGSPCDSVNMTRIKLYGFDKIVHKNAAVQFKLAELLSLRSRYGRELARIDDTWKVQTFACRPIRGSSSYSKHSYGIAVDIKPGLNPMRDDGALYTDFDKFGVKDGMEFVKAWTDAGFRWGAVWSATTSIILGALKLKQGAKVRDGRTDPMHMELGDTPMDIRKVMDRLRKFRKTNPELLDDAMKAAKATDLYDLVTAWRAGKA